MVASLESQHVRIFEKPTKSDGSLARVSDYFGKNVFDLAAMSKKMVQSDVDAIRHILLSGGKIDAALAERLAAAVREWASERGATHFCHWFQPQTGTTAEKHDGFVGFDAQGHTIERFTGKELLQSEPDASSFPSGGRRSTFEARGYTGWDPSSPMFLMENENGNTLYIPSVFVSHHGEALDFKVPLLRSIESLSKEAINTLHLLGEKHISSVHVNVGAEQEFFLVDAALAKKRPDIVLTGRSVFGKKPAKGQELEDHYFAKIPTRVHAFMQEVEMELYKVGVPVKTRHNEVAPRQFEFAPIFESANIANDHNQLMMNMLRTVASRHNFMVLLHEKPFAGVNGSGKHVNWSMQDSTGRNLLEPGKTPHQNIVFLTFLTAVLQGIHEHADVIRASVASAGNDHRLGANEAPPAIMSVFLGEMLDRILVAIEEGSAVNTSAEKALIDLGVSRLPTMFKDNTDRNRTSPFAFTGNKFEFRAVGSSAPIAFPTATLNAAVASGLAQVNAKLNERARNGVVSPEDVLVVLRSFVAKTRPIRFEGNGYSQEWRDEAARRGLGNFPTTPAALDVLRNREKVQFMVDARVLSNEDVESRLTIQMERYVKQRMIELNVGIEIAQTRVLPVAMNYLASLAATAKDTGGLSVSSPAVRMATEVGNLCNRLEAALGALKLATEKANADSSHHNLGATAHYIAENALPKLEDVRSAVDALEAVIPYAEWPLPHYADLLFSPEI